MPKKHKGESHSTRPLSRRSPSWCRYTLEEVEALVVKLAREGNPQSRIGVILRDQYGIPLVKTIVGKGIVEILKENNLGSPVPEDLEALLRKAARLRTHLERNRTDKYNRKSVQVIESKIHRLSRYYKRQGVLPEEWKYTRTTLAVT
ncbi:MAG: 30S ribosomal protein S15 [Candidatus Bathyarchaeota archaeon]|nr:30S ribosomal protein S15 [Candidatus Bathyarchaeota archaeon]